MAFKPKEHASTVWNTYVVYSPSTDRQYAGLSGNADNRLIDHNRGKLKSTKGPTDWELIGARQMPSWDEADRLARALNQMSRRITVDDLMTN